MPAGLKLAELNYWKLISLLTVFKVSGNANPPMKKLCQLVVSGLPKLYLPLL